MENIRFKALERTLERQPKEVKWPSEKASDYYGDMVFKKVYMREFLSEEAYTILVKAIEDGERIDRRIADQIAASLKAWAISKGARHYTHWFQPLTGSSAEKHDSFIDIIEHGKAIESFYGTQLIQQEPDASSFPNGGIRNTFEARGYTAWDPTSPAFILDETLCLPTIFVSYTGEALDYKTPLLKTLTLIDKAATEVCKLFDKDVTKVHATLGWEQEYFLVDSALYNARPDLMLTGRTLFGHASAKDQQLEDHYFGVIPKRVVAFMKEYEIEAHKLGIPVKTRHNEVAPNQYECAPIFEEVNLAVDHNQLLMHILEDVAQKHNFNVLLHEKPYSGVNGSGKHNNWSLATNTGINLLSPGKTSKSNFRFLTFLAIILKAVKDNAELLRGCIASAGNDLRLGANEAPPAIISAFIGSQLSKSLDEFEKGKVKVGSGKESTINIPKVPEILMDNTDRNRTSPFAFTGNKFEFRAVGSSANCSASMIVLNTIVANQLIEFKKEVDLLIKKGTKKEDAIYEVIRTYIKETKAIRFEGNSYSDEWIKEAEKRGLPNIRKTPDALKSFVSEKTMKIFTKHSILNERELHARYEIKLENYIKKIQIESRVMGDIANNHLIPVAIRYQNILIENVNGLKNLFSDKEYKELSSDQLETIKRISKHVSELRKNVVGMINERKNANKIDSTEEKAKVYCENVLPYFENIRLYSDKLELLIDDKLWPLPKYRELLFVK